MLHNATYKEKFNMLQPWMPAIVESIKKDLKSEHLSTDHQFVKTYLAGKAINGLNTADLAKAYAAAIADGHEKVGEFIANRWLLKHGDVYAYFDKQLRTIAEDFSTLVEINQAQADPIMHGAVDEFGPLKTYLFSVMNSVVFPSKVFADLRHQAEKRASHDEVEAHKKETHQNLADAQKAHERDVARLTDKYEKKLVGMQKKYVQDTESLKKQIASMQRKLTGAAV